MTGASNLPSLVDAIASCGVIAVVVLDREEDAVPTARALLEGGIDVLELTLRTPAALAAVDRIRRDVPEMLLGVGTVLTTNQASDAHQAGAKFAVAPGLNRDVVSHARQIGLPFFPGICTPSDIEAALSLDCRIFKFFPARSSGGLPHLESIAAPYRHLGIRYIPLGGLRVEDVAPWLASPLVLALGGSWLAPRDLIAGRRWSEVANRARAAADAVEQTRIASD